MLLADGVCALHADPLEFKRLRASFHALRKAQEERAPYHRIHQLVRAIEGFTKASGAEKFSRRCARLIDGPREIFKEIYRLRNEVEHLDELLQDFQGSDEEKERQGRLRAWQAERIASTLFNEIVSQPRRRACFQNDNAIGEFWSTKAHWHPEHLVRLADLDSQFESGLAV